MTESLTVTTKLRLEAPEQRLGEAMPTLMRFILDHKEVSITVRRCAGSGDVIIDGVTTVS